MKHVLQKNALKAVKELASVSVCTSVPSVWVGMGMFWGG